ncbi:FMN-dependent NADH-azoreductase [Mycoplasmopsis hyopharyngis]|uniref:FMN-dependent NADH-azoreductase n=1 Tax=Mycoplasmopsis hyopharyngis TaxID=29558 RepID=UPI003873B291
MNSKIKILALNSSPNMDSLSKKTLDFLLKEADKNNKNLEIENIDLNNEIFANSSLNSSNMANFFQKNESDKWIEKLKNSQLLILSFPMINFSYPAVLKNFIDSICVANKTFSYKYSKQGDAIGLLNNLKVVLISTQGAPESWYPWGKPLELLTGIWKFLGAKQIETLLIDGTKTLPNKELTHEQIIENNKTKILQILKNIF